jgi:hypothetical protein
MLDQTETITSLAGVAGVLANSAWPLLRERRSMLQAQAGVCALFLVHYAGIGALTGGLMTLLACAQALAAIPLGARPGFRFVYLLTLPLIAAAVVATWQGPASAFAALALALSSLGRYQQQVLRFRGLILASVPCWMAHNLLVGSLPGLTADILFAFTGGWAFWAAWRAARGFVAAPAGAELVRVHTSG